MNCHSRAKVSKGPNILGFVDYRVSVVTYQLCLCSTKAAIVSIKMGKCFYRTMDT